MFMEFDHAVLGRREYQSVPFKLSKTSAEVRGPAPLIGQHTREVMEGLLGLSRQEVLDGYDDGTLWPADMPRHLYIEEALK
jgi:crotonobetainyl-CoA:carnitine CoA-transferase CaiB-like acyl-CoA transferase